MAIFSHIPVAGLSPEQRLKASRVEDDKSMANKRDTRNTTLADCFRAFTKRFHD